MDFNLSQDEMQLKEMIIKFVDKELAPFAAEYDKKEKPEECIPWPIIESAIKLGLGSAAVPQEFGGSDLSNIEIYTMLEELAIGDSGFAYTILSMITGAKLLLKFGTQEQKDKWLRRIADVEGKPCLVGFALSEPQSGCDNMSPDPKAGIATTAELEGDEYVINGTKSFITNAGIADLYFVWARTDKTKGGPQGGISTFLVSADTPGLKVGKIENKMGNRLSQQGELIFDNCRIPKSNLLGSEGMGFKVCMGFVENRLPAVGAIGTGIAQAAFNVSYKYSKERVQGGAPIINHQAIAHKMSDMVLKIESSRLLYQKAASYQDKNMPSSFFGQMSKVTGSEVAVAAANDAIQILGCYGCSREYPAEKLLRDSKALTITENGNEIHRNKIMFRIQKMEEQNKK